MEPQAPPRRRPYDSMSVPVVAGHPDQYVQPYGGPQRPPQPPPYQPQQPPRQQQYQQPQYQQRRAYRAQLVVDGTPRTLELKPGSNLVGRGSDADLQLMDQGVSRRHADVHLSDGQATVYDLGSTNGTSVNGHSVQSQQLQHGDVLRVGHTRLVFHEDSS
jgi:pSer/pThr/pTyr-binding forkhead associated (FHA) protein